MKRGEGRDRFMDFLRVASLVVVVLGHWLALVPYVQGGAAGGRMLYAVDPRFWFVTWIFQVIPLFFFVGGFANHTVYRRLRAAGRGSDYLGLRLRRLLLPTLVFLGFLLAVEATLNVLDLGGTGLLRGMRLGQMAPFAQLWFLGVYLVLVVLSPLTLRLHARFGLKVIPGLLIAVAATDLAAFALGRPHLLGLNLVLVWLIPHQLGHAYAAGDLREVPARGFAAAAALSLAVLAGLTSLPFYGRNLLDNGVTVMGITAPTLPFAVASVGLVAAVLAVRRPLSGWLDRPLPWRAVTRLNAVVMTVFLWHLVAYYGALAVLFWAGLPLPARPDLAWWLERPLFVLLPSALLAPLVVVFGRFERRGVSGRRRAAAGSLGAAR